MNDSTHYVVPKETYFKIFVWLLDEVISDLGSEAIETAVKEQELSMYQVPQVEVLSRDTVTLKAVVPLMPVVTLGDYQSIRVERPEAKVDESRIDALLAELQSDHAEVIPVDRGAAMGDQLGADVQGIAGDETIADEDGITFTLSEEAVRDFPPGFAGQIVGMTAGETRTFRLAYPADFPREEMAGREAEFTVAIHAVKERRLPPLDDELARTVGDFESLADLKAQLREGLQARAEAQAEEKLHELVLDELVNRSQIEFPPIMVEQEIDQMIGEREAVLRRNRLTLEQWLRSQDRTLDGIRDEWRPLARHRLTRSLALGELVRQEHIELQPGEAESAETDESRLLAEKAIKRLVEIATAS
jgi:trigger factor